jgi:spermidine synthase
VTRLLLVLLLTVAALAVPTILHEAQSPFGALRVLEEDGERILQVKEKGKYVEQSRCRVQHPDELVYDYSRMQTVGLLYPDQINSVLVVGLGGGSLSKALAQALPAAEIVSVELDPRVADAARRFFFYTESERVRTVEMDARAHLQKDATRHDLIFLDAFSGTEIPRPLRTVEFYRLVRSRLQPSGAVVANLILESKLYSRDLATLHAVFPHLDVYVGEGQNMVVGTTQAPRRKQLLPASLGHSAESLLQRRVSTTIPKLPVITDTR